jgi:hypothetical protein
MDWSSLLNNLGGLALTVATVAMVIYVMRRPEQRRREPRRRQRW